MLFTGSEEHTIKVPCIWLDENGKIASLGKVSGISNHNDCKDVCKSVLNCIGCTAFGIYTYCHLKSESQSNEVDRATITLRTLKQESKEIKSQQTLGNSFQFLPSFLINFHFWYAF